MSVIVLRSSIQSCVILIEEPTSHVPIIFTSVKSFFCIQIIDLNSAIIMELKSCIALYLITYPYNVWSIL